MVIPLRKAIFNIPNILTMFRIVLIPLVLIELTESTRASCFLACVFFSLASITDFFDGYLARKTGNVSVLGKFLDPLADKLIVLCVLIQLVAMNRVPAWMFIVILSRELIISGLRSIASTEGIVISAEYLGQKKTAFQLVGMLMLLVHYAYEIDFFIVRALINFHLLGMYALSISLFLSVASGIEYFYLFSKKVFGKSVQS